MKILIVNHRGDIVTGGVEQRLIRMAAESKNYDIELSVVVPEYGPLERELTALGIPVKVVEVGWQPRTHSGWSRYMKGLDHRVNLIAAWAVDWGADLIHTNTFNLIEGALSALKAEIPHVWHVRSFFGSDPEPYAFGGLGLDVATQAKILYSISDGLLSVSAAAAHVFAEARIPFDVIHNPINVDRMNLLACEKNCDLREELGLARGTPLVVSIARFSPEKDLPTFIDMCSRIHTARPEVHYLIIGDMRSDPSVAPVVLQLIADHGIQGHMHLLGERSNLPGMYPQFDLVVVTSTQEGLSNVVLEAMSLAVPIVATRSGGPELLIQHGQTGLLVPVRDSEALAAASLSLLADSARAKVLGKAAQEHARQNFSEREHYAALLQFYERVLKNFDAPRQRQRRQLADALLAVSYPCADMFLKTDGSTSKLTNTFIERVKASCRKLIDRMRVWS